MTKDELKKKLKTEIADWWRTKFCVELKDDICQKLIIDEIEELCNKIAEPREKRIAELEKKNAELKEYNKYLKRKRQGGIQKQYNKVAIIKQQAEQLTKAVELLKWALHSDPEHDDLVDFDTKWKEAEQFLKEIEK